MIKVYGSSDDLVEVEGDINEEFGVGSNDTLFLSFSEGTAIRISYNGEWEIRVMAQGLGNSRIFPPKRENDEYSDVFTLEVDPPVLWVMAGERLVRHA